MQPNSLWKEMLGVVVLVIFAAVGAAHVAYPDRFIPIYLRRWYGPQSARLQIRIVGMLFTAFATYLACLLLRDLLRGSW